MRRVLRRIRKEVQLEQNAALAHMAIRELEEEVEPAESLSATREKLQRPGR